MKKLKQAIEALQEATEEILAEFEQVKTSDNVPLICNTYKEIYDFHKELEALTKIISGIKSELSELELPEILENNKMDSLKTGGRNFFPQPRLFISIKSGKEEEGCAWLRELGYDPIIKETVNGNTLSSSMLEFVRNKGVLPPEEFFNVHIKNSISMRKA